jgi:hypothetical protein
VSPIVANGGIRHRSRGRVAIGVNHSIMTEFPRTSVFDWQSAGMAAIFYRGWAPPATS